MVETSTGPSHRLPFSCTSCVYALDKSLAYCSWCCCVVAVPAFCIVDVVALLLFLLSVLWTGAVFPRLVCKSSKEELQPSEKPVACMSIQTLAPHSVHIGAPKLPLILWRPVHRRQVRRLVRQQALSAQDRLVQGRDLLDLHAAWTACMSLHDVYVRGLHSPAKEAQDASVARQKHL